MSESYFILWSGPLLLAAVGMLPPRLGAPRGVAHLGIAAALFAAVTPGAALALLGVTLIASDGLYLDPLAAGMTALVSLVGSVVLAFGRSYLEGEPRQGDFFRGTALTLAAVLAMIQSGNLLVTGAAWLATGVSLRRLLTFYPERPAAQVCARKNLIVSRLADLLLLFAALLVYREVGSLDYANLFARAHVWRSFGLPADMGWAAALIALAALLKSAQFPTHGWLMEVMETPTPVSALLHAGIINGGGFVILRLSPLIGQSGTALALLAIIGGVTALFGSVVMLTQTSIKGTLACSTVAQMGFMMLECGLGAYSAAGLHLVAHSLYKAHAFLRAGSAAMHSRPSSQASPRPTQRMAKVGLAVVLSGALVLAAGVIVPLHGGPSGLLVRAILMLGLVQLLGAGLDQRMSFAPLIIASSVALTYSTMQRLSASILGSAVPPLPVADASMLTGVATTFVVAFAAITAFQIIVAAQPDGPIWRALHAHVVNGFYVNTLVNRMMPATRPILPSLQTHRPNNPGTHA